MCVCVWHSRLFHFHLSFNQLLSSYFIYLKNQLQKIQNVCTTRNLIVSIVEFKRMNKQTRRTNQQETNKENSQTETERRSRRKRATTGGGEQNAEAKQNWKYRFILVAHLIVVFGYNCFELKRKNTFANRKNYKNRNAINETIALVSILDNICVCVWIQCHK